MESFEKNKGNGEKKREIEKVVTKNTVESLYSNNQHWRLLINSNKKIIWYIVVVDYEGNVC